MPSFLKNKISSAQGYSLPRYPKPNPLFTKAIKYNEKDQSRSWFNSKGTLKASYIAYKWSAFSQGGSFSLSYLLAIFRALSLNSISYHRLGGELPCYLVDS